MPKSHMFLQIAIMHESLLAKFAFVLLHSNVDSFMWTLVWWWNECFLTESTLNRRVAAHLRKFKKQRISTVSSGNPLSTGLFGIIGVGVVVAAGITRTEAVLVLRTDRPITRTEVLRTDRPILGQFGAETTVILMHSDTSGNFWKRLDTFWCIWTPFRGIRVPFARIRRIRLLTLSGLNFLNGATHFSSWTNFELQLHTRTLQLGFAR